MLPLGWRAWLSRASLRLSQSSQMLCAHRGAVERPEVWLQRVPPHGIRSCPYRSAFRGRKKAPSLYRKRCGTRGLRPAGSPEGSVRACGASVMPHATPKCIASANHHFSAALPLWLAVQALLCIAFDRKAERPQIERQWYGDGVVHCQQVRVPRRGLVRDDGQSDEEVPHLQSEQISEFRVDISRKKRGKPDGKTL